MSIRFAPSPTGRFHIGNLRTAWVSHQLSRFLQLPWIVRFEDIDQPRVIPGAMEKQLEDMKTLGLIPDKALVQTEASFRHESLFKSAVQAGIVYPCSCSRKEILQNIEAMASAPHAGAPLYDGRCRDPRRRRETDHPSVAWRFANPADGAGKLDFIVARTNAATGEFSPSYHWACAVDDFDGDHRVLVRASDLKHVIPLQAAIHRWIAEHEKKSRAYPAVFHASLVVGAGGERLEKRTRGITLPELLERGIFPDTLLDRFEASFDARLFTEFSPGKIWGEPETQRSLIQLGLSENR